MAFDIPLGGKLAAVCQSIYDGDLDGIADACDLDKEHLLVKETTDQLALIASYDDHTLVAFRGTQTAGGWLDDFEAIPQTCPPYYGLVHAGFVKAESELYDWVARYTSKDLPVQVTGHSLGGALATLTSYWMRKAGYDLRPVITFGCPKVGDGKFVLTYPVPHYRVIYGGDPVPHVPLAPFQPHGTIVWYDTDGNPYPESRVRELLDFVHDQFADHHITNYISVLSKGSPDAPTEHP